MDSKSLSEEIRSLLAIDSNFMIGPGVSNTSPRILTITDDNGFLFVNFGPLLSIAKFNSNGEIENVIVDTYNHDEDIYLGYPYRSFQSTKFLSF